MNTPAVSRRAFLSLACLTGSFNGLLAQLDPGNVPIDFTVPVDGITVLTSPGSQPYQVYRPTGPFIINGSLELTDGAFMRYGGLIVNNGTLILSRDSSSGFVGSISVNSSSSPIELSGPGFLRLLGGSIYSPYLYDPFFVFESTARLTNREGHTITNGDGALYGGTGPITGPSYTGILNDIQLTNEGDIASTQGTLSIGLNIPRNTPSPAGGSGYSLNSATGEMFATDGNRLEVYIRGASGRTAFPNIFTNEGFIGTFDPDVLVGGPLPSGPVTSLNGGTLVFSSILFRDFTTGLPIFGSQGVYEGLNPILDRGGMLDLDEIEFRNTGKTLENRFGRVRFQGGVTVVGGTVDGDDNGLARMIIEGRNFFRGVSLAGEIFSSGTAVLLDGSSISGADFAPTSPGGTYGFELGQNLALTNKHYQGNVSFSRYAGYGSVPELNITGFLSAEDSLTLRGLKLTGPGTLSTPLLRLGADLDLSAFGIIVIPTGQQVALDGGGTFTPAFLTEIDYSQGSLSLVDSQLDLGGSTFTAVSGVPFLVDNSVVKNGTFFAETGSVTVKNGTFQNLSFGGEFIIDSRITLTNTLLASPTIFTGSAYEVRPTNALNLNGHDLTLIGDVTWGGNAFPTNGKIVADMFRTTLDPSGSFAAGPSGGLVLTFAPTYYGYPAAYASANGLTLTGGDLTLRLDPAAPSPPSPSSLPTSPPPTAGSPSATASSTTPTAPTKPPPSPSPSKMATSAAGTSSPPPVDTKPPSTSSPALKTS